MTSHVVPHTQQAIVQCRYGAVRDVLALSEAAPVDAPGPREVQVHVLAAAVNPIDWQMIEGNRRLITRRRFPFTPLFDLAGVVTAVGDQVTSFRVGDRVHADNETDGGGASEYVNVPSRLLAHTPTGLDFAEAAALPLAGQTAMICLDNGRVTAGTRVAVIGASGGVGHFAVQMARTAGAFVVGVSSARNQEFVRLLGADEFIDRNETDLSSSFGADSFDVVIDCVGGREQWIQAQRVLRPGGRFVTIARDEDGVVTPTSAVRLASTITARRLRGVGPRGTKYIPVFLKASGALLQRVNKLVEDGRIHAHLSQSFPLTLEGVNAAIDESRAGRTTGKLALLR
ncbi:NADPH:quinone reductase-like Zn-dependent oxidoreductase [Streptomyces sp. SAI-135]|uniref:NAD(P)-dependent alcohol dehydrogenase n=1 Tax=unclassified Streptomyces TaxID=2593676 RepID=UPI0024744017|nr:MULTISPECIES: NAD(P)-dependent alcohol dehydrogenase [unclassified Streptomyces]MDH6523067.1 NADPH:quinone reductase-like Zn-dependent oxidoreductase [Streptomyces sp. SAI-090]MDH6573950.1 NADPH:quinone reductase-like Zn-dependent oxidoreductase [Streptomyces sp. SAI-117]MDH6581313.1 NADPH:quinone reductase-like Zn-dependent oxidoreductase [Streptomyces sp. SAI-133]MDH6613320.1 NADPH:quinone reductase-like Zn-dependent oxidoreductase [Streptomyces sp. SAI-135]